MPRTTLFNIISQVTSDFNISIYLPGKSNTQIGKRQSDCVGSSVYCAMRCLLQIKQQNYKQPTTLTCRMMVTIQSQYSNPICLSCCCPCLLCLLLFPAGLQFLQWTSSQSAYTRDRQLVIDGKKLHLQT